VVHPSLQIYCKARDGHRIVSQAIVVAIGIAADGRREVLGFDDGLRDRKNTAWPAPLLFFETEACYVRVMSTQSAIVTARSDYARPLELGTDGLTNAERIKYGALVRQRLEKSLTAEEKAARMQWLRNKFAA
jgi:hypothetical protein